MTSKILWRVSAAFGAMALAAIYPAAAQDTPPAESAPTAPDSVDQSAEGGLADIVVTAQKRAENLQNVPIAVTAVTGAALEDRAAVTLQGLQGTVPNVVISNFSNTPQTAVFSIRGIGVIEPDPYAGNTVAIVVDGIPQYFSMGALLDLYDIERIEILRGPQGTLFGANTTGGVVNVVTRQPTGEFGGRAQVGYGNYDRIDAAATIDFPIIPEVLAGKVAVSHSRSDGYTINTFDGSDMGKKNVTIFRGYLKLTPSPDFDATLIGEYDRARNGAPIFINGSVPGEAVYVPPGTFPPGGAAFPQYPSPCVPAGQPCHAPDKYFSGNNTVPDQSDMDTYRATLTMNLRNSGIGDITSITGYKKFTLLEFTDQDGTAFFLADTIRRTEGWQFSQELRTSIDISDRWNVIAGGFYLKTHYDHIQNYRAQFAAPGFISLGAQDQDNYAISGFLQNYIDLTDNLRLQAGIRYSHERTAMLASTLYRLALDGDAAFDGSDAIALPGVLPPDVTPARDATSWDDVGWKLGLDYTVRPGLLFYGYWARGFKSGAYTGRLGVPEDLGPADPEQLDTFEIGFKGDFLDRRLRFNLAGFYTDYKDIQLAVIGFRANPGGGTIQTNSIINAAAARIKGFEAEVTALPVDGLTLTGSLAYLDAKYKTFLFFNPNTTLTEDLKGFRLQNAPKWSATAGFTYELEIGPGALSFHALYSYVSSRYQVALNNTPRALIQPTHLVDANIDYKFDNWSVGVWGTNLFDNRYMSSVFDAPPTLGLAAYAPPRRYGVMVKTQF